MVSAEASPFASTGGLGEVLQGLPKALVKQGHEVAVALPFYPRIRNFDPQVIFHNLRFASGKLTFAPAVAEIRRAGVRYLFLDIPSLFDRPGIYGNADGDYPDNILRYAALCSGALAIAQHVFTPDIIHCHDWPTGLLPVILAERLHSRPALMHTKTVFTIHNLAHQGFVERSQADTLSLNGIFKHPQASMLRGALETATEITTVSPTYAAEICRPSSGFGLDRVLTSRSANLHGILNGIDAELWNPATDPLLPAHFSKYDLSGKRLVKAALLREFGLSPERMNRPLIGVVARLASQKGLDLLSQNPHQFLDLDASLIVLGDGDPQEEDFFRWFAVAHPDKVAVRVGFDLNQSHRIIGGSDVLLMPSRFEPCGLTQLYAMRYGTLPIVYATGGLKDTVTSADGFIFNTHSWRALRQCLREMTECWETTAWSAKQSAAMDADFSWDASATSYASLYSAMNHN